MFGIWDKKKIGITIMVVAFVAGLVLYYNCRLKDQRLLGGLDPKSYDVSRVILDIAGDEITLGPQNYDADDAEAYSDQIEQKKLAEDLRCFSLDIDTVIDQDEERSSTESFEKMSLSEIKAALAESLPTAHIWYDQEGFIAVIMLYGETIREE